MVEDRCIMDYKLSLYVHVPFCVKKCLYCDFLSFSGGEDEISEYFDAVINEILISKNKYSDYNVSSVFIGGGTPSFVASKYICKILDSIRENFHVRDDAEISIEVNPASAIYDKLKAYRASGINRLSIGAQSMNDEELKCIGRAHNLDMFYGTYENAIRAGFDNINIDVMSALPDQSLQSYMNTLSKVVELKPQHISAYSLIVEEGTPFYDMELNLPDEDIDRQMYHETKSFLSAGGYHRYEISNYALNGRECSHNKVYWQRGNYLGLGLGASSMVENVRWNNVRDINKYIRLLKEADVHISDTDFSYRENMECLSEKDCMEEFMFLGLRLVEGINIANFRRQFHKDIREVYGDVIEKYIELGLLEFYQKANAQSHIDNFSDLNGIDSSQVYLRLTDKGLDVSNTVMSDFLL